MDELEQWAVKELGGLDVDEDDEERRERPERPISEEEQERRDEAELEAQVQQQKARFPQMLKQLDDVLTPEYEPRVVSAQDRIGLEMDPYFVDRLISEEPVEDLEDPYEADPFEPQQVLPESMMEQLKEWMRMRILAQRMPQLRADWEATPVEPFRDYAAGLEKLLSQSMRHLQRVQEAKEGHEEREDEDEEGSEMTDVPPALLPKMSPGKYHWTDERFVDGIVSIKLFEETQEIEDEEMEHVLGEIPTRSVTFHAGILVDLAGRKLHVVSFCEDYESDTEEDDDWITHDIPSQWVTALKQVKWPEPWNHPLLRYRFPCNKGVIVDRMTDAYPLEFGISQRF